jgi:hypothetical protein
MANLSGCWIKSGITNNYRHTALKAVMPANAGISLLCFESLNSGPYPVSDSIPFFSLSCGLSGYAVYRKRNR